MPNCLTLKKSNCKNCYKCIRHCPVKAIRFSGNQAHIIGNECILCGRCFVVCPQNAKEIVNETENAVLLSIHQNNFPEERYSGPQVFYSAAGESAALAEQVQSALVRHLAPTSNRKSKQASGIYLMEHIQCTGLLIECGFLSNVREEQLLRSEEYQKQLSAVVAATVCSFLSNT